MFQSEFSIMVVFLRDQRPPLQSHSAHWDSDECTKTAHILYHKLIIWSHYWVISYCKASSVQTLLVTASAAAIISCYKYATNRAACTSHCYLQILKGKKPPPPQRFLENMRGKEGKCSGRTWLKIKQSQICGNTTPCYSQIATRAAFIYHLMCADMDFQIKHSVYEKQEECSA